MIRKKVNGKWVKFDGLKYVKKGDIFQTIDCGCKSPLMQAREDARQIPHPRIEGKMVWAVKAPFIK